MNHKYSFLKIILIIFTVVFSWIEISSIGQTLACFNDIENSTNNTYSAGFLDFSLTNTNIEKFIGVTLGEDIKFSSMITKTIGSLDIQYKVYAEKISGDDEFCKALQLEVSHSAISYNGNLLSFNTPPTTKLGTWVFKIKLPHTTTNFPPGAKCNVDLVFQGWRDDVADFSQSGFTDEERIHLRLTSRMIVLNEFLPNPDPSANGLNFGQDNEQKPKGEWVELYNNSNDDFNVAGWYLTDADGHRIDIEPCRTNTGNTIIPAKGFLVVYKNGGEGCGSHNFSLNNDGDTVKLFNNEGILIDSYSYDAHDYCQLEPTPGEENSTITGSGNCEETPPNKSYARIPDGIGDWVDPIPTPGKPNILEKVDENKNEKEKEIITDVSQITTITTTTTTATEPTVSKKSTPSQKKEEATIPDKENLTLNEKKRVEIESVNKNEPSADNELNANEITIELNDDNQNENTESGDENTTKTKTERILPKPDDLGNESNDVPAEGSSDLENDKREKDINALDTQRNLYEKSS